MVRLIAKDYIAQSNRLIIWGVHKFDIYTDTSFVQP